MHPKHPINLRQCFTDQQQTQKQLMNPNKTLSWSSINSNYQESISPLNYKVTNPSSSLIMSALSHIREDDHFDVQTTGSTLMYPNGTKYEANEGFHKRKGSGYNNIHGASNDFYRYLMMEQDMDEKSSANQSIHSQNKHVNAGSSQTQASNSNTNRWPGTNPSFQTQQVITSPHEYMVPPTNHTNKNFTLMDFHSNQFSAEQSLHHLEQSQQELTFLKIKLQQAYQKLQKEILNSYELEQRIDSLRAELNEKDEFIELQKNQNQKLKFTLKAILKNRSFLEEEMERGEIKKANNSEVQRENQLKENLKLKLQLKDLTIKLTSYEEKIQLLTEQSKKLTQQLTLSKKDFEGLKIQIKKKDQYLESLSQQLQSMDQMKVQIKNLLTKQTQFLNKINVLELQLRKVTDQKVTSVSRLKHEIAMVQKQNQQLLEENQTHSHQQFVSMNQSNNHYTPSTPFVAYSPSPVSKRTNTKSCSKYSVNRNVRPIPIQAPMIFDSQDEDVRVHTQQFCDNYNYSHSNASMSNNDSLNLQNNKNRDQQQGHSQNKENVQSENLQQSFVYQMNVSQMSKTDKNVGKWKRAQSVSNNSSLYVEGFSKQQNEVRESIQNDKQRHPIKERMPEQNFPIQKIIEEKLSTMIPSFSAVQTQDQKLTKYQKHRKNIQNELAAMQKIKRPTKEERQKMQKLQKQLYYVDSDIAGLKRKIRRKY